MAGWISRCRSSSESEDMNVIFLYQIDRVFTVDFGSDGVDYDGECTYVPILDSDLQGPITD